MTRTLVPLLLVTWLGGSGVAAAQSTAPDPAGQAARELLSITLGGDMFEQMTNPFVALIVEPSRPGLQKALNRTPTEADLAAFRGAIKRALSSVITSDVLADALVPLFSTSFSVDEINELIAFHRTPLGRKLLDFQQQAFRRGAAVGQELMERKQVELMEAIQRELTAAFPQLVKPGQ